MLKNGEQAKSMEFTSASERVAQDQRDDLLDGRNEQRRAALEVQKQRRAVQKQEADDLENEFAEDKNEEAEDVHVDKEDKPTPVSMEDVITAHQPQLESMNLPQSLWARLVQKLAQQTLDAGTSFGYSFDSTQPPHLQYDVHALESYTKESNVWIVPHIWSFPDESFAVEALSSDYSTALRVSELMGSKQVTSNVAENETPGSEVAESLMSELQRYAYPLFDSEGQRYYYVMNEFGSRVRMITQIAAEQSAANNDINTTYGVVQSLLDGFTYTVIWLHTDVAKMEPLRRAPQHRLSLLGRGKEAWETRFEYETAYDWYGGWDDGNGELKNIVLKHISNREESKCLIVGTGTSTFPLRMCESGYQHVHGTDYVEAVIHKMKTQTEEKRKESKTTLPTPTWGVMDATDMSSVAEGEYDAVLDKGCMDAMLIPEGSTGKTSTGSSWVDDINNSSMAMQELSEIARVLKKGGVLLLFSFHPSPEFINALVCEKLELINCYEITNLHPKTRVPTTKTFKDMFRVYIFTKP